MRKQEGRDFPREKSDTLWRLFRSKKSLILLAAVIVAVCVLLIWNTLSLQRAITHRTEMYVNGVALQLASDLDNRLTKVTVDLEMLAEPHRFLSGGGRVLLARWGEEIVGMVMLELQGKGQCELLKFGVKEAYRGRGIGTALMEGALQAARDAGQKKAVLTSNHQLREALRLYERFGFKYVTYSDKWFQLSDIRMEREL